MCHFTTAYSVIYILISQLLRITEAATRGALEEKVFLEISQNSPENTRTRVSFLIKRVSFLIKSIFK